MPDSRSLILNNNQVRKKLDRMAYEVLENFSSTKKVVVVGVAARGFKLAKILFERLSALDDQKFSLIELVLAKDMDSMVLKPDDGIPKNASILLVDDVLNTGKTLMYAAGELIKLHPKALKSLVMVNRRHRQFPIRADIVGLTLSTTLKEHIEIDFKGGDARVYLK